MIESHEIKPRPSNSPLDRNAPDGVPAELAGKTGADFWTSLEELSGTERFQDYVRREYPTQAARLLDLPERRTVLKLMGASLALAGFNSCTRQPDEKIVPYAKNPEALIPGQPLYFATAMPWTSGAIGLLVENHMGRPTKTEGNELHPASLGATDAFAQACVLDLYDPDRATRVTNRGRISTWDEFLTTLRAQVNVQTARQGAGLRILSPTITSPTLAAQARELLTLFQKATWTQYEPVNRDQSRAGAVAAFGQDVVAVAQYDKARTIVSFEHDFLGGGPEQVRGAREFTKNRRVRAGTTLMNRLYCVESAPSQTGAMADHRLAVRSMDVGDVVRAVAKRLGVAVTVPELPAHVARFAEVMAKDLEASKGVSIVTCGEAQPPAVHALVHAINAALGNAGKTVRYIPPVDCLPQATGQVEALRALVADMQAGRVEVLLILGSNPVYDAPADADFKSALAKVPFRAQLALHEDETSLGCDWLVPMNHFLESWSDARAFDGTVSIVQPLIAPLYGGKSAHDVVAALMEQGGKSAYDLVRAHWQKQRPDGFETAWRRWLHDGIVAGTQATPATVTAKAPAGEAARPAAGLEVAFKPDPSLWDGRFANNGWLQELPRPITKITWDNTIHVSPRTAERLGLAVGDVVAIEAGGRRIAGPVWVSPGHADESLTVHLGGGRAKCGHVGTGAGFDAYPLRTSSAMWTLAGAVVTKTGESTKIASTQEHVDYDIVQHEVEKRELMRVRALAKFTQDPHSLDAEARAGRPDHGAHGPTSLYTPLVQDEVARGARDVSEYQWAMVIDLNACTACGACVTACVAENNIPVVGKDQVLRGREMHWMRIDRYFEGPKENPRIHHQPIPCMQCENAPCETVCPVGATTHSPEGLNEMTYNRCVGTRYCSNNCPYKVRHFNFLLYSDYATETLKLQRNPDVTVRSRGVMEKCTYCVQRINQARITAKREDRSIRDGEVVTACQQVCPASAITFGNKADPNSAVAKLKKEPHNYALLDDELQTRPRTTHLAKVMNKNPELEMT